MLGAGVVILAVVAFVIFLVSRLQTVPYTKALIISGSRHEGEVKVVPPGGRTFVIPILQDAQEISLGQKTVELDVEGLDANSVAVTVRSVAQIKVGSTEESIRAAAQRFLDSQDPNRAIIDQTQQVLLGSLRAIIATMTVSELIQNRETFQKNVQDMAVSELGSMGLTVASLVVNEISDRQDYIVNLGVPEAERVKREARIARARNEQQANDAEVESRTLIAEKNKDLAIQQARMKAETDKQREESDAAGPLAKAEQSRRIAEIEQAAAHERAILRERQLDTEVRRPADAALYEAEKQAEAEKVTSIRRAEAEAARTKLSSEATAAARKIQAVADADAELARATAAAQATRATGEAEAAATSARGEAQASATRAQALAEADGMEQKAAAFEKYNDAARLELLLATLPKVAHELAAPMGNIKDLRVISTDGASSLTKTAAGGFGELGTVVEQFTGVSLTDLLKSATKGGVSPLGGAAVGVAAASLLSGSEAAPAKTAKAEDA
jgi:flotillin